MTEWTDEQRRQFAEYRRKGEEERAQKETTIEVGDHVETPEGTGWAVEQMVGGFRINLDKDLRIDWEPEGGLETPSQVLDAVHQVVAADLARFKDFIEACGVDRYSHSVHQ